MLMRNRRGTPAARRGVARAFFEPAFFAGRFGAVFFVFGLRDAAFFAAALRAGFDAARFVAFFLVAMSASRSIMLDV
ncbi:MAG TPA: hypothetical protein VJ696_10035 [Rhodanobacteraceae bacterium]|nr:hypothetical protein [Rhodanobacteraceae bacterium]